MKNNKQLHKTGFYPGIYNYCDRICELCNKRDNCVNYVMEKKLEEKGIDLTDMNFQEHSGVGEYLKNLISVLDEIIVDIAKERNVEPDDIYMSEKITKYMYSDNNFTDYVEIDDEIDIFRICSIYNSMMRELLDCVFAKYDEDKVMDADYRLKLEDALFYVENYGNLINERLREAVSNNKKGNKAVADSNGFAKIALLIIDTSMESWTFIKTYLWSKRKAVDNILVVLRQLKSDVSVLYPDAMNFQRPGLD